MRTDVAAHFMIKSCTVKKCSTACNSFKLFVIEDQRAVGAHSALCPGGLLSAPGLMSASLAISEAQLNILIRYFVARGSMSASQSSWMIMMNQRSSEVM